MTTTRTTRLGLLGGLVAVLLVAGIVALFTVRADAALPEFSTDDANPTLVLGVPDGFVPGYRPAEVNTKNNVTETRTFYSRVTPGVDSSYDEWSAWSEPVKVDTAPELEDTDTHEYDVKGPFSNEDYVPDDYTEWAKSGDPVRSENAPGSNTEFEKWEKVSGPIKVVDVEAVAEVWANFSPDQQQGPFTGPPVWDGTANADSHGTWHIHSQIPGGHEGPDGVYQRDNPGNGRADWFYRENGVDEQSHCEYLWQKYVRESVPGHDETFYWTISERTRTLNPGTGGYIEYVYTVDRVPVEVPEEPNEPVNPPAPQPPAPQPPAEPKKPTPGVPFKIHAGL